MALINSQLDESYANTTFKLIDDFFSYIKTVHPSILSNVFKSKLQGMNEKCGHLLTYWDSYDKNNLSKYDKIEESLWLDNVLLRYIFEDFITYDVNRSSGEGLFCIVCKVGFDCNSVSLINHLNDGAHLSCFKKLKSEKKHDIWRNIDIHKWAFEKLIEFRPDKTLFCKLCGVSISYAQSNLVNHLEGTKHLQNFESIANFKFGCNNKFVIHEQKSQSSALLKEQHTADKTGSKSNIAKTLEVSLKKESDKIKPREKSRGSGNVTKFRYFDPYAETDASQLSDSKDMPFVKGNKHVSRKSVTKSQISLVDSFKNDPKVGNSKGQSENASKKSSSSNSNPKMTFNSLITLTDVESHGSFMNKVVVNIQSEIRFYCQPCGYFDLASTINAIKNHVYSLKHQQFIKLKSNLASMKYNSYNCEVCNIEFVCSEDFILYHDKSKQHKQMCRNSSKNKTREKLSGNNQVPFSSPDNVRVLSKDLQKDIVKSDLKMLQLEMKSLLTNLLKNTGVKTNGNKSLGFFCCACSYWTKRPSKWSVHVNSKDHEQNMCFEIHLKTFTCNCGITLLCDDSFYSTHLSWYEHKNLKTFILQKSISNNSNLKNSSSTSQVRNRSKHIKKLHKSYFSFQLTGVSSSITEDEIAEAFSKSGEIEFIDLLGSDVAEVYICLREDLSVSDVERFTKQGLQIPVGNSSCLLKEKPKSQLPDEVVVNFSKNRHSFFEKLFFRSNKEFLSSFTTSNGNVMKKTVAIEADVMEACKVIKTVTTIGSRAIGIALEDSVLDLFVDLYNTESGRDLIAEEFTSILIEVKRELNSYEPPLFKNVNIDGSNVVAEHITTELMCKLIFNNRLSVENTELIRLYVNADKKVKQLVIIVREWMKSTEFSPFVSNYAVTWMVLYYLMQSCINFVNPVARLFDEHCKERKIISGGGDCTFPCDIGGDVLLKSDQKVTSLDELLLGFFVFYGNDIDIACVHRTLTGKMVGKTKFTELEDCKVKNISFNITKGLCLQDPLELNKNLTEHLQGPVLYKVKELCAEMATILSEI